MLSMTESKWWGQASPTLDDIEELARKAFAALPARFLALCGDVVIRLEDFADEELLTEMGIEDPFELTGLYHGVDLTQQSHSDTLTMPAMVTLYRRPLLDEWADGDVGLGTLVTHVLVHEIGHHFGLSDADIEAIELEAEHEENGAG
jgi:predicted Zn-dependent protease with MMP-like domain